MTYFAPPPKKPATARPRNPGSRRFKKAEAQVQTDAEAGVTLAAYWPPHVVAISQNETEQAHPDNAATSRHTNVALPAPQPQREAPPSNFERRNSQRLGGDDVASLLRPDATGSTSPMRALLPHGSPRCGGLVAGPSPSQLSHAASQRAALRLDLEAQMREKKESDARRKAAAREEELREEAQLRAYQQRSDDKPRGAAPQAPASSALAPQPAAEKAVLRGAKGQAESESEGACAPVSACRPPAAAATAAAALGPLPGDSHAEEQQTAARAAPQMLALLQEMQAQQERLQARLSQQADAISTLQLSLTAQPSGSGDSHSSPPAPIAAAAAGHERGVLLHATSQLIPVPRPKPQRQVAGSVRHTGSDPASSAPARRRAAGGGKPQEELKQWKKW